MKKVKERRVKKMYKQIIFFSIILLIMNCQSQAKIDTKDISLKGKKILMVIAPEGFRDEELFVPKKEFEKVSAEVIVASTQKTNAKGMLGGKFDIKITLNEIKIDDYVGIVIVGGVGSIDYLWYNEKLHEIVKKFNEQKKVVSAICLSPVVLAISGVLKGKNATVFITDESKKEFLNNGVKLVNKDIVVDGNIVTANGPRVAKDFALNIIKLLGNK